jgi:putative redox protein
VRMSNADVLIITLPGGRRSDAQIGRHEIQTDQPIEKGGQDSAPSPFDLFLASIGTCAGIFVQGFCAKRSIPYEGVRIVERPEYDAQGTLVAVDLQLQLPSSFPERYRAAIVKVVEQCSVKRAILAQPVFRVAATIAPPPEADAQGMGPE